jgi:ABC-type branched-subunit amino acid transport system permease subunit
MTAEAQPLPNRTLLKLVTAAAPILIVLILVPSLIGTYQLQLVIYGLIAAIAALGFNLLLGYTGLLSFGHSAYFGVGAYSVAFAVASHAVLPAISRGSASSARDRIEPSLRTTRSDGRSIQ